MSRTYKATGINLKGMAMGESDRLLTILTKEQGLIRAIAPGARKHHSRLGGRSGLFVVNELLLSKGRSLDKITQAETLVSYPGLSRDLGKLTAGQYLAELVLYQALSHHPQEDLFCLLTEHLERLEQAAPAEVLPLLAQATFHLLALAGIAPQVQACSLTQRPLLPDWSDPDWRVGFSPVAGGIIDLAELEKVEVKPRLKPTQAQLQTTSVAEKVDNNYQVVTIPQQMPSVSTQVNAIQLTLLQQLAQPNLPVVSSEFSANLPTATAWITIERLLRQYAQYHFERQIRSAALIDTCFVSESTAL